MGEEIGPRLSPYGRVRPAGGAASAVFSKDRDRRLVEGEGGRGELGLEEGGVGWVLLGRSSCSLLPLH